MSPRYTKKTPFIFRFLQSIGKPVYYILVVVLLAFVFSILAIFTVLKHIFLSSLFQKIYTRFFELIASSKVLPGKLKDLFFTIYTFIYKSVYTSYTYTKKMVLYLRNKIRLIATPVGIQAKYTQQKAQKQTTHFIQSIQKKRKGLFIRFLKRKREEKRKEKIIFQKRKLTWKSPFLFFARHKIALFFLILFFIACIAGVYAMYLFVFKDLPSVKNIKNREQIVTTKIYDRYSEELYSFYEDENRTVVTLSDIPQDMIDATIAIEDADFYSHYGFSPKGIVRALKTNIEDGTKQGGSTITQQLVKNTLLTPEKTLQRKIREVVLAFLVEREYSKQEILEMYFNEIAYGGTTYGVEEASQRYFGKSAKDLSLAESSILAGLPAAPSSYSPFGPNPELAVARQHEVLRRMLEEGFITPEEQMKALEEELTFVQDTTDIKAPHFVMYVRDLLAKEYGEEKVFQGGLEVYTSLDLDLQNKTQDIVTTEVEALGKYSISNGAALVTNPQTGEILAMVGSRDYFDVKNDGQVNVTVRSRQPGSSIKPLTYALALENEYTPASIIKDTPITYQIPGSKPYTPKNYDGRYHGNVTLRKALANSYNIPAVKLLASLGVNNLIDKAEKMGIDTWKDRSRFGLSLTLGGGEVFMTDMAELYGTFANKGKTVDLNPILYVRDYEGKVLYENTCALYNKNCESRDSLDPRVAFQISNILSDNNARSQAFGRNSVLHIPDQEVAVKTGTTNSMRDNWTIGYTQDRLVAVWVGNNDNSPMSYVASGITGASPIWNKIIRTQLSEEYPHTFDVPDDIKKEKICGVTGTLMCSGCPYSFEEYFVPGTEPTKHCNPAYFKPKEPKEGEEGAENDQQRNQILEGAHVEVIQVEN